MTRLIMPHRSPLGRAGLREAALRSVAGRVVFRAADGEGALQTDKISDPQPGMSAEATHYLIDHGIRVMGIDASGWDIPIWKMHEERRYYAAHRVMLEKDYCHMENLANLHLIPKPFGFKLSVLPIKFRGISGSPVRAVAMIEE